MTETVDELTPDTRGVWRVTTCGSTHIWDLDGMRYTRCPGPHTGGGAMAGDGEPQRIVQVVTWPRVGERSHVVFDGGPVSDQWRISSTIAAIERVR